MSAHAPLPVWTPASWAKTYWPERLVTDFLDAAAALRPDRVAMTGRSSMTATTVTLSWRQLRRIVDRIAAGLVALGVEKGEVVACQLPNWWEFVALHLACVRIGALTNPLMPIFRQRELRYMLAFAKARVLVVPRAFRGFDHAAMADSMRADLPELRQVLVVGGRGPDAFERVLVERATRRLGAAIVSAWGMTETGSVTTTVPGDADDKVFGTDGVALPGMQVRVVDAADRVLEPGREGRLQCRGIGNFIGYFARPELSRPTADGWFDTGDLAVMDDGGYIRITGRAKDILIRGGENVPVVEVEDALYRHPAVREVAIVGMPDARLGERACAFVSLEPGASLDFAAMVAFLEERQMARQYFPERLEIVDELPRTASGKVQKYQLRERARALEPATD